MKMKKFLTLMLTVAFLYTSALPAWAAEGGLPSVPEQEGTVRQEENNPSIDVPEPDEGSEPVDPAPDPDETPDPVLPDPVDPVEPVEPVEPDGGETTDTEAGDDQDPGDGEDDGEGEDPADPEDGPLEEEDPEEEDPEEDPEDEAPEEESRIIDVLVPANSHVTINPYRMKVAASYGETTDQIVHDPQAVTSYSDFPVQVSAQAVGRLSSWSTARFAATPPANDAKEKEIFMYVEFQDDPTLWIGAYGDWPNQILVTDWGMEKENVMTLDAFGVGYFRLLGAMTNFPDIMWGEEDVPDVILAFTFSPAEIQPVPMPEEELPLWEDLPVMEAFSAEQAFPAGENDLEEPMIPENMETDYGW